MFLHNITQTFRIILIRCSRGRKWSVIWSVLVCVRLFVSAQHNSNICEYFYKMFERSEIVCNFIGVSACSFIRWFLHSITEIFRNFMMKCSRGRKWSMKSSNFELSWWSPGTSNFPKLILEGGQDTPIVKNKVTTWPPELT